ncbi:hypothetical protein G7Y89_g1003 [Cudoniella acicularis]|uniref:BTB domain-containing protein n=1 Tax=Cudoniella acicularis TaxID=354080 RepID=A0A8H4RW55_9HELO|nr:hypothetical protein G7Y89_g1003 [Cudoniella acicularis]
MPPEQPKTRRRAKVNDENDYQEINPPESRKNKRTKNDDEEDGYQEIKPPIFKKNKRTKKDDEDKAPATKKMAQPAAQNRRRGGNVPSKLNIVDGVDTSSSIGGLPFDPKPGKCGILNFGKLIKYAIGSPILSRTSRMSPMTPPREIRNSGFVDLTREIVSKKVIRPGNDFPRFKGGDVYIELKAKSHSYCYTLHSSILSRASSWFEETLKMEIPEYDNSLAEASYSRTRVAHRYEMSFDPKQNLFLLFKTTRTMIKLSEPEPELEPIVKAVPPLPSLSSSNGNDEVAVQQQSSANEHTVSPSKSPERKVSEKAVTPEKQVSETVEAANTGAEVNVEFAIEEDKGKALEIQGDMKENSPVIRSEGESNINSNKGEGENIPEIKEEDVEMSELGNNQEFGTQIDQETTQKENREDASKVQEEDQMALVDNTQQNGDTEVIKDEKSDDAPKIQDIEMFNPGNQQEYGTQIPKATTTKEEDSEDAPMINEDIKMAAVEIEQQNSNPETKKEADEDAPKINEEDVEMSVLGNEPENSGTEGKKETTKQEGSEDSPNTKQGDIEKPELGNEQQKGDVEMNGTTKKEDGGDALEIKEEVEMLVVENGQGNTESEKEAAKKEDGEDSSKSKQDIEMLELGKEQEKLGDTEMNEEATASAVKSEEPTATATFRDETKPVVSELNKSISSSSTIQPEEPTAASSNDTNSPISEVKESASSWVNKAAEPSSNINDQNKPAEVNNTNIITPKPTESPKPKIKANKPEIPLAEYELEMLETYNSLFLTYYSKLPTISTTDIETALRQTELLLNLAEYFDSVGIVRPYLSNTMFQYGREVYKAVLADPPRWLFLSIFLQSAPIFKEAIIHIVGMHPFWPSSTVSRSEFEPEVLALIDKKVAELQKMKAEINEKLLTNSIVQDNRITHDAWLIVQQWRDWFASGLAKSNTARVRLATDPARSDIKLTDGLVYRQIAKGGETYLPLYGVLTLLREIKSKTCAKCSSRHLNQVPETKVEDLVLQSKWVSEDLLRLKDYAMKEVKSLAVNESMLEVEEADVGHFTCTRVETNELPWERGV